jgi:hypothetical protein
MRHTIVKWLIEAKWFCVTRFSRLCYRLFPRLMIRREMAAAKRLHEVFLAENPRMAERKRNAERFRPYQQAFRRALPEILDRFRAEADGLIDPAIVFDADEGDIEIVERIQLIEHFGAKIRPRGERPDEAIALVIQGGDLVKLDRACDPRTHPDEYPWAEPPWMLD